MDRSAKNIVAKLETLPVKLEEGASFKVGFFLCRAGTASLIADGTLYHLQRGSLLMLYPNEQIHVLHYSDDLEGRMEVDYIENYYPTLESIDVRSRIVIRNLRCITISEERAAYLHDLCDLIHRSATDDAAKAHEGQLATADRLAAHRHRFLCSALLVEVARTFLMHEPVDMPPQREHETLVNNFLTLMLHHCHEERTVVYYAQHLHLSPYYLSGIIKKETGKTALEWLTLFTINLSKHYLADTEMSIKEIADMLHFPDQSTFGRYFKQRMGCSPGEYRKSIFHKRNHS